VELWGSGVGRFSVGFEMSGMMVIDQAVMFVDEYHTIVTGMGRT
jgi:hypothetical protein